MDVESPLPGKEDKPITALRRTLLLLSVVMMAVGSGGSLATRIYFLHGGERLWLASMLQTSGFPILLLPLSVSYLVRRRRWGDARIFSVTGWAAAACLGLGLLMGFVCYTYVFGSATLPASTTTLLASSELASTSVFAFILVRQRFTPYTVNAVFLLVTSVIVLGMQAIGERPHGVSSGRYRLGFVVMLGSAVLFGLVKTLVEFTRRRMRSEKITYIFVLEMQLLICISASVFSTVCMLINKDFQAIPREAKAYGLGETKYYLVLLANSLFWQLSDLGSVGVVFCSSALLASILSAMLLPILEVLAVFLLHEKFNGWKAVSMVLALWGFGSYLYGEHKRDTNTTNQLADAVQKPAGAVDQAAVIDE